MQAFASTPVPSDILLMTESLRKIFPAFRAGVDTKCGMGVTDIESEALFVPKCPSKTYGKHAAVRSKIFSRVLVKKGSC